MFRIVPAPGQCSINISDHHDCFEEHDREDTRTEKGRDNEWRSQRAAAREAGEPRLTHPVLRHTGLELLINDPAWSDGRARAARPEPTSTHCSWVLSTVSTGLRAEGTAGEPKSCV